MTPTADKNALWTPGDGLQVWIPDSARKTVYRCRLCPKTFGEHEQRQWVRHVKACAKSRDDAIQAKVEERSNDILFTPADKERSAYFRKNGIKRSRRLKGVAGA